MIAGCRACGEWRIVGAFRYCTACWLALPFEAKRAKYINSDARQRARNARLTALRGLLR